VARDVVGDRKIGQQIVLNRNRFGLRHAITVVTD
jgi:hypothetical protein